MAADKLTSKHCKCTQASRRTTDIGEYARGRKADRQTGSIEVYHVGVFVHVGVRMAVP